MVKINTTLVTIGDRSYNKDKSGYPSLPTVFSGVDISWGAGSCIEHPDPSRAQISLWVPKTHEDYLPTLGEEVSIEAEIEEGGDLALSYSVSIFAGKVESVKLQDDHEPFTFVPPGIMDKSPVYALNGTWIFTSNGVSTVSTVTLTDRTFDIVRPVGALDNHAIEFLSPFINVVAGETVTIKSNFAASPFVYVRQYRANGSLVTGGSLIRVNGTSTFIPNSATTKVRIGHVGTWGTDTEFYFGPLTVTATNPYQVLPAPPGYRVNVVAADALAEASRLRLSDTMWPFEFALNRQARIAELATSSGVEFSSGLTTEQGYYEALGTSVRARDVDSFPALEAFQRTTMAAGHTVISAENVVQPSMNLKLPQVLLANQPTSGTVYGWNSSLSTHEKKVNGVLTRTNWASVGIGSTVLGLTAVAGTSGDARIELYNSDTKFGNNRIRAYWEVSATAGVQGLSYKRSTTGASASRVSGGMWVRPSVTRSVKLAVNLFSGVTARGSGLSSAVSVPAGAWTYIKFDGVTATGSYDSVEVMVQAQTNMLATQYIDVDGVLIEKTATGGGYFDQYTLDAAADVVASERSGIPAFDSSVIIDDTFELDTSDVVNEVNVELKRFIGSAGEPGWEALDSANADFNQKYTDEAGSRKTTPQSRSIASDWAIQDAFWDDLLPSSVMVTKGRLLLAGQSKAQWKLSSGMTLVLEQVPTQEAIYELLRELNRFGALIRIDNGPSFIPQYMRVKSGRIVLGEDPLLEFQLEPVEYSAPIPLSGATLAADDVASNYLIKNFKTLSSNDLRSIGAR